MRINSQRQPIRGGPPAWELGKGLTTSHRKKTSLLMNVHRASELNGFIWNDLGNKKRI
jgi:hypothetical protein